jgi:nucleoside 2-deoxyribosyltransferase
MSKEVYLAGPIAGLTAGTAVTWRSFMTRRLADYGIGVRDPLRDTPLDMASEELLTPLPKAADVLGTPRAIVARDRFDVKSADVVVANLLEASRVSIGTMVELGWASNEGKPIVVIMKPDNIHAHPFIDVLADYIVTDLYEAVSVVRSILNEPR